jgi:hypothetical protein
VLVGPGRAERGVVRRRLRHELLRRHEADTAVGRRELELVGRGSDRPLDHGEGENAHCVPRVCHQRPARPEDVDVEPTELGEAMRVQPADVVERVFVDGVQAVERFDVQRCIVRELVVQ